MKLLLLVNRTLKNAKEKINNKYFRLSDSSNLVSTKVQELAPFVRDKNISFRKLCRNLFLAFKKNYPKSERPIN